MDFGIDDDAFSLAAMTSPDDLADKLNLIAGKLAAPGWDPNTVTRARAVMLAGYPSLGGPPARAIGGSSCRAGVCPYVEKAVVAVASNKKIRIEDGRL